MLSFCIIPFVDRARKAEKRLRSVAHIGAHRSCVAPLLLWDLCTSLEFLVFHRLMWLLSPTSCTIRNNEQGADWDGDDSGMAGWGNAACGTLFRLNWNCVVVLVARFGKKMTQHVRFVVWTTGYHKICIWIRRAPYFVFAGIIKARRWEPYKMFKRIQTFGGEEYIGNYVSQN